MATEPKAESTAASTTDTEASYMAGLEARLRGEVKDDEAAPADDEGEDDAKPAKDEGTAAAEDEKDGDDGEDEEKPDAEKKDEDDAEEDNSEVDEKALRKLQKEKRSFERVKTEVLELERAVKEREQRVHKAESEWSKFFSAFDVRPVDTLLERGMLDQASIDYLARQFFLHTTEARKDPRSKAEAERLQRDRARDLEARRANERIEKFEREREAEKAQAQEERQLNDYVSSIRSTLPTYREKTPLLSKAIAKDPSGTERELFAVAYELAKANNGQFVGPGKVLVAWEKQERARLERHGFSTQTEAKPAGKPDNKAKSQTAAKSQGQVAKRGTEVVDDDPAPETEEAYHAELARRLKRSG